MIRILIILTFLSTTISTQAQLISDKEFYWFYKIGSNCKNIGNCKYYVSAEQDPILSTYSHDEFILALDSLYDRNKLERIRENRIIKLRLAFPLDSIPLILNAGIKNGEVSPNELELLHEFVATWDIIPAQHRNKTGPSICRLYIYWKDGRIEKAIWRRAVFKDE